MLVQELVQVEERRLVLGHRQVEGRMPVQEHRQVEEHMLDPERMPVEGHRLVREVQGHTTELELVHKQAPVPGLGELEQLHKRVLGEHRSLF